MTDQASERRQVADGSDNVLQLQEISTSLIREGNLDALYWRILDAAISLLSADMGSMQVLSPERSELRLWHVGDFILYQRPSGNGSVSIPLVAVAWLCPRGLGSWCRTLRPVTLWLARATSMRIVGQVFARCSPRHLSRGPASCWA